MRWPNVARDGHPRRRATRGVRHERKRTIRMAADQTRYHPGAGRRARIRRAEGQGRVQRHRRRAARQVSAHGQVPRRRRAAPNGGFGFCDVVFGWDSQRPVLRQHAVTGWQHGFPDALARLDLDTSRRVPWDDDVPFFLGDFVNADGSPPGVPAPDLEARAEARRQARLRGDGRHGVRVVQLPRDAAELGRQARPAPHDADAGHVRLLAAAHGRQPRVLQRADGRDAGVRRADRGPAHRDRPRRLRGGDRLQRSARSRPTARSCSRPAPRRSASASASCRASWRSGARSTRAARATSTRACPTARTTCSTTPRARAR